MFSVNVLLFGDNPQLAKRCLDSVVASADPGHVAEVRVGLNAVGHTTRTYVKMLQQTAPCPFYVYEEATGANVMKYPMMRRMLYDPRHPVHQDAKSIMWFDDDSYVTDTRDFFGKAHAEFQKGRSPLMGSVYLPGFVWTETERKAIAAQPWFAGYACTTQPKFITGGWWVADLEFLAKLDYPFRELRHNGGDTILGEVLRQQGKQPHHYREDVAINADVNGKESKAKRRGLTTKRPFESPPPYDYTHHDFEVRVVSNLGT